MNIIVDVLILAGALLAIVAAVHACLRCKPDSHRVPIVEN